MTEQDQGNFNKLMGVVFSTYGRKVEAYTVTLYFKVLSEYEFEDVAKAFYAHLTDPDTGQYWPKPADLIRHVEGGKGSRAMEAWDQAVRAVESVGPYTSVAFGDRLIHAVIDRMGGWPYFCTMSEDGINSETGRFAKGTKEPMRVQFTQRYAMFLQSPPSDIPSRLIGINERETRNGKWAMDPRAKLCYRTLKIGGDGRPERPMLQPAEHLRHALPSEGNVITIPPLPAFLKQLGAGEEREKPEFDSETYRELKRACEEKERARRLLEGEG